MRYQKGESGNPAGKPTGAVSKYVKVRNDFFKAYYKLGGFKNFLTLFETRRWCRACGNTYPEEPYKKFCDCGELLKLQSGQSTQKEFFFKVLPGLMPKKFDLDAKVDMDTTIELSEEEQEILREIKERLANPNRDK